MACPVNPTKPRPWTKEDISTLKTLERAKTTAAVIARKLKRSVAVTYQKAPALGVSEPGMCSSASWNF
jgi:hypothetical protein